MRQVSRAAALSCPAVFPGFPEVLPRQSRAESPLGGLKMSPEFDNATNPSRSDVAESSSPDSLSSESGDSQTDAAHSAAPHEGVAAAPARAPEQSSASAESEAPASNSAAPQAPAPESGSESAHPATTSPDPATAEAIADMESEGDTNPDLGNV